MQSAQPETIQVNVYLKNEGQLLVTYKTWTCNLGPYQALMMLQGISVHLEPSTFLNHCRASNLNRTPALFEGQRYLVDGRVDSVFIVVHRQI